MNAPAIIAADIARVSMIGSRAFLLETSGEFDLAAQRRIWGLAHALTSRDDVDEIVPGMTNLLVLLKKTPADPERHIALLRQTWDMTGELSRTGRLIEIPVHYGGEHAVDLPAICTRAGLTASGVIARHHARTYTVFALGSAPGFGYLHGLDPAIYMPRKTVPSLNMPKGSVTIGGMQAGVSVLTGPNGWNSLGYAEVKVFDPHAASPAIMAPGDTVRFLPERIEL
jgi:KipI family sensor histidine kinase inhibitor